jgi:hypothetical protein
MSKYDLPADQVLSAAVGELTGVVILGYDKEGNEYFAANYTDAAEILWLIERMKLVLLDEPERGIGLVDSEDAHDRLN